MVARYPDRTRSGRSGACRRSHAWTERHNYDDYLAWRTERGFTATFEAMLTGPFVINYYDIPYFGEGIASTRTTQH